VSRTEIDIAQDHLTIIITKLAAAMANACSAPDAPELYGRVWCCPPAQGEGGAA
jgi:hypothetical protein